MPAPEAPTNDPLIRKLVAWCLVVVFGLFVCCFLIFSVLAILPGDVLHGEKRPPGPPTPFQETISQHFAAAVGLPIAALAALCLVFLLESTAGRIEFEAVGFKFRGASGPIILWVIAFLAIAAAIKMLW
jgi:hypothetical protein